MFAALFGTLLAAPAALFFFGCLAVGIYSLFTLVPQLRHHREATLQRLHLRHGLWKTVKLERGEIARIETDVFRARTVSYPILVTAGGKEHRLPTLPHPHEVETYLVETWRLPADTGR